MGRASTLNTAITRGVMTSTVATTLSVMTSTVALRCVISCRPMDCSSTKMYCVIHVCHPAIWRHRLMRLYKLVCFIIKLPYRTLAVRVLREIDGHTVSQTFAQIGRVGSFEWYRYVRTKLYMHILRSTGSRWNKPLSNSTSTVRDVISIQKQYAH